MALATLDPNTALIIVDLQKGIIGLPAIHPIGDIIERARALADAFRERDLPVVLVNVAGGAPGRTEQPRQTSPRPEGWTDLTPELNQQPRDIVVTKRTWGAFASTDLEALLKARDVTQVVIAGVATGTGVEATARQAYEAGFNVTLALDAMTDVRPEAHHYSIRNVFPRLGETGTTQEIVDLLSGRSA
ncbi:isochorismatase family protein [Bradyrhizobium sp. OAE829]|uniref:isochorismatase family protein n=1 Tax=Bradyrhizobium sp. OAE829 TaxID=2663807 RepID=UPI00178B0CA5